MTQREELIREVLELPENALSELLDHAKALRTRNGQDGRATAIASEKALAKDWLRPEEDEAWSDL